MVPAFMVRWVGEKAAPFVFAGAIALLLIAAALGVYFFGRHDGSTGEVAKQQSRTIETQTKVGEANGKAADTRVDDAVRGEQQKQELNDALTNATSGDDARRRAGCAILRQQGRDTTAIAACR